MTKCLPSFFKIFLLAIGLQFVLLISAVGADAFAKFNVWFFAIQFSSLVIGGLSYTFIAQETDLATNHFTECHFYCDASTSGMYSNSQQSSGRLCVPDLYNFCLNGTAVNTTVTGWRYSNLQENFWWNFTDTEAGSNQDVNAMCNTEQCTWTLVFAVLFPMATGIMEGANLSGDLKGKLSMCILYLHVVLVLYFCIVLVLYLCCICS